MKTEAEEAREYLERELAEEKAKLGKLSPSHPLRTMTEGMVDLLERALRLPDQYIAEAARALGWRQRKTR